MKRALSVLVPLAVLVVLIGLLLTLDQNDDASAPTSTAPGDNTSDLNDTDGQGSTRSDGADGIDTTTSAGAYPPAPTDARPARVLRLADGDSFDIEWIDSGERDEVRLFGINAPESDACYGDIARDVLDVLTDGETLLVESIQRDEFGRVLGNVWVEELFVNATLVELGAALALSDGGSHAGRITEAQAFAQATSAGLWDAEFCGADPGNSIRIEWIESDAPGRDNENQNGEWIELANDGANPADMTDWSVRDESTRHRYYFPDGFVLQSGDSVRVFSGCGNDVADELYWCDRDPVWNNGGDTGFLVDADGKFVDTWSYGS